MIVKIVDKYQHIHRFKIDNVKCIVISIDRLIINRNQKESVILLEFNNYSEVLSARNMIIKKLGWKI